MVSTGGIAHAAGGAVADAARAEGAQAEGAPPAVRTATANAQLPVVLLPTRILGGRSDEESSVLAARAQEVNASLGEALRESMREARTECTTALAASESDESRRDLELLQCARDSWVVAPQLKPLADGRVLMRIAVVAPNSQRVVIRVLAVTAALTAAKAVAAVRDELRSAVAALQSAEANPIATPGTVAPPRSSGRPIFAIAGGLFGAYAAFSVQRAAGSEDTRVLYPLLAIGTAVGVAAALIASEEWDVTSGNAWFMATAAAAGAGIGLGLGNGIDGRAITERYAWGLGGSLIAVGLGTAALVKYKFDEGDAALVAGSAVFGGVLGGLSELTYEGRTVGKPQLGSALGAAVGLTAGTLVATRIRVLPGRIVLVGTGAALGALVGAAATSPLVFEDLQPGRTRVFLLATIAGTLTGAALTLHFTRNLVPPAEGAVTLPGRTSSAAPTRIFPTLGPMEAAPGSNSRPWGIGLTGQF